MDSLAACPPVRSSRAQPSLEKQQEMVSVKITAQSSTSPYKQHSTASVPLHRVVRPVLKRSGLESMAIPVHSSFGAGTSSFKLSADFNKSSGRDANFSQAVTSSLPAGMPVPSVDIPRLPSREVHQQAMLDTISRLQQDRGLEVDYNGSGVKVSPRSTHMGISDMEEDGTLTPSRRRGQHHRHQHTDLTNIPAELLRSLPPSPRRPEAPSTVSAFQQALRERERILRQPALLQGPTAADCRIGVTESVDAVHLPFIHNNRHATGALRAVDSARTIPDAMASTNSRIEASTTTAPNSTSLGIGHVERVVSGISARSHASALRSTTSDAPRQVDVTQIAITPSKPTIDGIDIVVECDDDSPFGSQKRNSKGLTLDADELALSRQVTTVVEPKPDLPKSALRKPLTEAAPAHIPASPNHGLKASSLRSVREQLEWHMTTSARALIPLPPPQEPAHKLRATVVDPKDEDEGSSSPPGSQFSPRRRQSSINTNGNMNVVGPITSASRRNSLLSKTESNNRGGNQSVSEADLAAAEALVVLRRNEERMLNSDVAPPQLVRSVGPSGGNRSTKEAIYALSTPRGTRDLFLPAPPPLPAQNNNAAAVTTTSLMTNPSGMAWGSFAQQQAGGAVRASPSFRGSPASTRAGPRARGNSTTASSFMNGGRLAASPLRPSPSVDGALVSAGGESSSPPHMMGGGGLGGNSAVAAVIPPISHSGIHSSTALQPTFRRARPMAVIYAGNALPSSPGRTSATSDTPPL